MDQPEGAQLIEAIKSVRSFSAAFTERIGALHKDLEEPQAAFLSMISEERPSAITQLQTALNDTARQSIDSANASRFA